MEPTNFEGIYRSADSPKRRAEVLERLRAGIPEKRIAKDLGIAPHALDEIVARLREEGEPATRLSGVDQPGISDQSDPDG